MYKLMKVGGVYNDPTVQEYLIEVPGDEEDIAGAVIGSVAHTPGYTYIVTRGFNDDWVEMGIETFDGGGGT